MSAYAPTITVSPGAINQLRPCPQAVIVTETNIPSTLIERVQKQTGAFQIITLPTGEAAKSFASYLTIIETLETLELDKSSTLIAVGGGVITDVAAFAAATYKRGMNLTLIPTSLLAMVDAAIGGKCGINTKKSKNSVGTFYAPQSIIIDVDALETLPQRQFRSGMAEIIKIALMRDASLFEQLKKPIESLPIETVINKAIELKMDIVTQDYKEGHLRKLLNFGHTIGHAIEHAMQYEYTHGECIAMGMEWISRTTPHYDELLEILDNYGLRLSLPVSLKTLIPIMARDKKRRDQTIDIALVEKAGNGFIKRFELEEFIQFVKERSPDESIN